MDSEFKILDKKLGAYDTDFDNFTTPGELTVTITLNEYRDLVSKNATRQNAIDAANKDRYSREQENKNLQEENARLKGENYDLKTLIGELRKQLAEKERPDA